MKTAGNVAIVIAVLVSVISVPVIAANWVTIGDDGKGGNPVREYYPQVDIREYKYKIENGMLYFKIVTEEPWTIPKYPVERWYINTALDTKERGQKWTSDFIPDYHLLVWMDDKGRIYSLLLYYENETAENLGKLDYLDIAGNTIEIGVKTERIENIDFRKIAVEIAGAYETFQTTEWNHVDNTDKFFIEASELKQIRSEEVLSRETGVTGRVISRTLDPWTAVITVLIGLNLILTIMLFRKRKEREEGREIKENFPEL